MIIVVISFWVVLFVLIGIASGFIIIRSALDKSPVRRCEFPEISPKQNRIIVSCFGVAFAVLILMFGLLM